MRDAEAFEKLVGALLAGVGDVLAHGEVREERVLLEDETDTAFVRLAKDVTPAVQPDVVAERDLPAPRTGEAGDRPQHRRLARTRRPDEGDGAVDVER